MLQKGASCKVCLLEYKEQFLLSVTTFIRKKLIKGKNKSFMNQ